MSRMTVLAFDPGGTTGWAMYRADKIVGPTGQAEYYGEVWSFGEITGDKHHLELDAMLELQRTDIYHVITENFNDRPEKLSATELISRDYIGVIDLWGQKNGVHIQHQQVSQAKGFVDDKKLKAMDLWSSSKHSRDATRHLVLYMITKLEFRHLVDKWKDLA